MVAAARCGLVRVGSGSSLRRKPSGGGWRRRASQGGARHEQWVMAQGVARMRRGAAARACAVAWALACKEGRRRAAAERRALAAARRARRRLRHGMRMARCGNQCRPRMRGGGRQAGARALQRRLVGPVTGDGRNSRRARGPGLLRYSCYRRRTSGCVQFFARLASAAGACQVTARARCPRRAPAGPARRIHCTPAASAARAPARSQRAGNRGGSPLQTQCEGRKQ